MSNITAVGAALIKAVESAHTEAEVKAAFFTAAANTPGTDIAALEAEWPAFRANCIRKAQAHFLAQLLNRAAW